MKKLFTLLCAVVFSIFSGVEYTFPKEDNFYFNSSEAPYFQVTDRGEVDYRSLYHSVHNYAQQENEMCDTTPYQDTREEWCTISALGTAGQSLYSPLAEGTYDCTNISPTSICYTVTSETDVYIAAPAAGTINTSHFACDYGSTMEYRIQWADGTTFVVAIANAKCWYCCANKPVPDDGLYQASTTDSLKGKSMQVGDVLCVGKQGTTVTITKLV